MIKGLISDIYKEVLADMMVLAVLYTWLILPASSAQLSL